MQESDQKLQKTCKNWPNEKKSVQNNLKLSKSLTNMSEVCHEKLQKNVENNWKLSKIMK